MDRGYRVTHCGKKNKANKHENMYKPIIIQKMEIKATNFFLLIKLAKQHSTDNMQCR